MSRETAITTKSGTTMRLEERHGETVVIFDHPDAPTDARHQEVGRLVYDGAGFQPAPFCAAAFRPETLRALANLIESARES